MCGAESQAIEPRKISGSVLQLCSKCAGLGKEPTYRESIGHRAFVAQTLEKRQQKTRYKEMESDDVLIGNLGSVVRKAREKMNIDHATLASKISEKKSISPDLKAPDKGTLDESEK